jgi:hypothetical protein
VSHHAAGGRARAAAPRAPAPVVRSAVWPAARPSRDGRDARSCHDPVALSPRSHIRKVAIARAVRAGWEKKAANPPQPSMASPRKAKVPTMLTTASLGVGVMAALHVLVSHHEFRFREHHDPGCPPRGFYSRRMLRKCPPDGRRRSGTAPGGDGGGRSDGQRPRRRSTSRVGRPVRDGGLPPSRRGRRLVGLPDRDQVPPPAALEHRQITRSSNRTSPA